MNAATMHMRDPTRDRFVGAARPHTPRLHSPPLWADATREPPPRGNPASLRTRNKENLTNRSGTTIGQLYVKRYSLRPGGSIFDAHLAHNWVTVSNRLDLQCGFGRLRDLAQERVIRRRVEILEPTNGHRSKRRRSFLIMGQLLHECRTELSVELEYVTCGFPGAV